MIQHKKDETAHRILSSVRTIAVIGLSADPLRESNDVARFLQSRGYKVFGVNPKFAGSEVNGIPVFACLAEVPAPIDMVDVFRRVDQLDSEIRNAVSLKEEKFIRAIWLQLGLSHQCAEAFAREQGLEVVSDRCPKIELSKEQIET